jgi:hypothetical protein
MIYAEAIFFVTFHSVEFGIGVEKFHLLNASTVFEPAISHTQKVIADRVPPMLPIYAVVSKG